MPSPLQTFFSASSFAVVGASSNPAKFGHQVFVWYQSHGLPVSPINPASKSISIPTSPLGSTDIPTVPSVSALPEPSTTALSIVTPPSVTRNVLAEASELGVSAVWLQPGSFDDDVLSFAREDGRFAAVIAGLDSLVPPSGSAGTAVVSRGEEGWCVLVDGERGLKEAGKL